MLFKTKAYILLGFFHLIIYVVNGQDQRVADRLKIIYKADTLEGEEKLELLTNLSFNEVNDLNLALQFAEELINLSNKKGNSPYLTQGYLQKGNAKQFMGNLEEALAAYFKSAEVAKKDGLISQEGSAYGAIADIYAVSDNHKNAMLYYQKAVTTLRTTLRHMIRP